MVSKTQDRWSSGLPVFRAGAPGPMRAIGGLLAMSADAVKFLFQRPFQGREFLGDCRCRERSPGDRCRAAERALGQKIAAIQNISHRIS